MTTSTATPKVPTMPFDTAAYEAAATRIRALNEQMLVGSKAAGLAAVDAYEKALTSLVDFEKKVAGAGQIEWVSAIASTHATFVSEVSAAYAKAARATLS